MFIDSTYFVGEINIPNLVGTNSNATALAQAIAQYEEEILIDLLGYKLYSLLIADLDENKAPQTQIYNFFYQIILRVLQRHQLLLPKPIRNTC